MSLTLSVSGFNVVAVQVILQYNCWHVLHCGQTEQSELKGGWEHSPGGAPVSGGGWGQGRGSCQSKLSGVGLWENPISIWVFYSIMLLCIIWMIQTKTQSFFSRSCFFSFNAICRDFHYNLYILAFQIIFDRVRNSIWCHFDLLWW